MATYNKRGYKSPKPEVEDTNAENEFEEVVASGESTTEEVFNTLDETASKTEEWVAKNQKIILGIVGAIALFTVSYLLYNKFVVEPKENDAKSVMFQSQQFFGNALSNPVAADSLFKLALNGAEGKLGFTGIADEFSGTKTGNLANYYAGLSYLNIKDFKNAEAYLLKFKTDDEILAPNALGALGDVYSELNKVEDAIASYQAAAAKSDNDYTAPRFLLKAAQLALLNNKKAEANKLFVEIKEKYETSREALNIDAYILMTE